MGFVGDIPMHGDVRRSGGDSRDARKLPAFLDAWVSLPLVRVQVFVETPGPPKFPRPMLPTGRRPITVRPSAVCRLLALLSNSTGSSRKEVSGWRLADGTSRLRHQKDHRDGNDF